VIDSQSIRAVIRYDKFANRKEVSVRHVAFVLATFSWLFGLTMTCCVLVMGYSGYSLYVCDLSNIHERACLITAGEYAQDSFLLAIIGFVTFGSMFVVTGPLALWAYALRKVPSQMPAAAE
jgi:hypothetical protein